jgi:hypothetical protein
MRHNVSIVAGAQGEKFGMFPYTTTRNDPDVLTKGYIIVVFVVKETLKISKGDCNEKVLRSSYGTHDHAG